MSAATSIRVVSLFCGAGGFDAGAVRALEALGREPGQDVELVAINHWEVAIETHATNHPAAEQYHSKIEAIHPPDVFEPGTVDLLIAGPSCTHFSTARGGKPVNEQLRASPWHVLHWVQQLRPEHVLLENVPEYRSWGPIEDGEPTRDGTIFKQWVGNLEALGYSVLWDDDEEEYGAVLNAADYGDPTSRRRLFIMASRSTRPTVPPATHSETGAGDTRPWRTASEIIEWADPGESIWTRDRPLVNNTMRRIAEGIRRHGHDALEPFADAVAELGKADVEALQERVVPAEYADTVADALDEPFLVRGPATDATGLCVPYLLRQQSGGVPASVDAPVPTVASRGAIAKIGAEAFVLPRNGAFRGLHSNPAYDPADRPLHTVTARNSDGHVVRIEPYLCPQYNERPGQRPRTRSLGRPLMTVPATKSPAGICQPYLVPYFSEGPNQRPRTHCIEKPLPTVTATGSDPGLARPYLMRYSHGGALLDLENPLPTITTAKGGVFSLADPFLVAYYGNSDTQGVDEPVGTLTTKDRYALCLPDLYPWGLDIRYRMLQPRELKAAMGFPDDYEIRGDTKKAVTKQIGNAVPVNLAKALVGHLLASEEPSLTTYGGGLTENEDHEVPEYADVVSETGPADD